MGTFKLEPGDVLLFESGKGFWGFLDKLFIKFRHVAMFYGYTDQGLPLLVESTKRGVVIRTIFAYEEPITVMRPQLMTLSKVTEAALKIAENPHSFYDYLCLVLFAVPRVVLARLGIRSPLKYKRNLWYICSEFVAEAYWQAGIEIIPQDQVPLPDDFLTSPILEFVGVYYGKAG